MVAGHYIVEPTFEDLMSFQTKPLVEIHDEGSFDAASFHYDSFHPTSSINQQTQARYHSVAKVPMTSFFKLALPACPSHMFDDVTCILTDHHEGL